MAIKNYRRHILATTTLLHRGFVVVVVSLFARSSTLWGLYKYRGQLSLVNECSGLTPSGWLQASGGQQPGLAPVGQGTAGDAMLGRGII